MQDYGARTVEWVHPEPPKRRLYNWSLEYIAPLNLKKNSYVHWKSGEKKECIKSKSWQYAMLFCLVQWWSVHDLHLLGVNPPKATKQKAIFLAL